MSRLSVDYIKDEWAEFMYEMVNIKTKGEQLLMVGDLNTHTGSYVKGKMTTRGKFILDLVESGEYIPMILWKMDLSPDMIPIAN